jgi:hypothetical protein
MILTIVPVVDQAPLVPLIVEKIHRSWKQIQFGGRSGAWRSSEILAGLGNPMKAVGNLIRSQELMWGTPILMLGLRLAASWQGVDAPASKSPTQVLKLTPMMRFSMKLSTSEAGRRPTLPPRPQFNRAYKLGKTADNS